ncbi:DNA methyltransferase 3 isoform X1 [Megalopta genalis]|uniref:DNA methyltransferase 3 isoform X1 n=3 Tax=Megalopta genalis TaxID=115081 RepID=UPI003FD38AFC
MEQQQREISSLVDQQQMAGMNSSRSGRDTVKSWAEGSVWSLVCAMELGLISEPCLTSVSFATLSDDGSLVKTSTPVPVEFPSINSTIGTAAAAASHRTTGLGFPARITAQSPPRKKSTSRGSSNNGSGGSSGSSGGRGTTTKRGGGMTATPRKSTTAERNVCAGWELDRELDRARNPTVENFWKSCKRKLSDGAATKRPDRSDQDRFETDKDLFPDRPRSVDLGPGICYQARRRGDGVAETATRSTDSPPQALDHSALDHRLSRENAAWDVSEGRMILESVVDVDLEASSAATTEDEGTVDGHCWEFESRSANDLREQQDDLRGSIDVVGQANGSSPTPMLCDAFETDLLAIDVASTSPPESFLAEEPSPDWAEDVDALPLADRISAAGGKWPSTGDDGTYFGGRGKRGRTSGSSASSDFPAPADVRRANDSAAGDGGRSNDGRKPRRRRKSNRDNDSRCKSAVSTARSAGNGRSTSAQPPKRKKTAANGNNVGVVATSVKDVATRTDAPRARIARCDDEYHDIRRVTRGSARISKENFVGKLVWAYCSGWWPALIIDAGHVGMSSEAGKLWVYWIGEARISLLFEKTQVEPFSANMEQRLSQISNVARIRAVDATMQMLRGYLGCTLTKPYVRWIENNFSEIQGTIDEVKFYPFPTKIEQRLAHLKDRNAQTTEKYLLDQERESQPRKTAEKPKEPPQQSDADLTRLPLREQKPGVITWAKIAGHNWWPAMIIDYRDCCMREPGFGCQWIMWYGDYKLSEIHHQSFLRFEMGLEKMRDYINNTKKHAFVVGVLQAAKDYCSRMGYETDNWTLADMFKYFSKMNRPQPQPNPLKKGESVKIYDKYSSQIVKELNELKNDPNVDDQRVDDIENSDDLRSVKSRECSMESLCLKCLKIPDGPMECHPFFEGSLCIECSEQYKPCMFVFGNDAKCFYCTICAATGMVIICDNEDCPRVYCTACMKHLLCPATYEQVLLEDPWECFLCKARSGTVPDTVVRPRSNWKDKIIDMFRTSCNPSARVASKRDGKPRRIRVLSLFDGLSTGLLVLRKLGLTVDVYYASEIDPDALMVSATHFGDRIVHLGDVRDITKEKIKEMAPIDLLIGGSPCNDLSLANPARLGLYDPKGTGVLFFEYCRILKLLKRLNNGHHLFWLYENVASMPSEYRLAMNKHLGQEPDVIDSADFSPQHRLRLYWHNLPFEPHSLPFQDEQDVQDILTPHCQRYALVKKIRTVTTKVNSLKQGKAALKPILMKDECDSLWITELEEIFGFPRHYTDVKNLSATKRQRLIGKSWSVQTLTAIFKSLCPYFECNIAGMDSALGSQSLSF